MTSTVFVGIEGFTLPSQFIVKELTMLFSNGEFNHNLFEIPMDYTPTLEDLTTVKYATKYIHSLSFTEGDMPYNKLTEFVRRLESCKVYCYGHSTRKLIETLIPFTPVIDVQQEGFAMPKTLPRSNCGRSHEGRNCSMSKAYCVKQYCENRGLVQ